MTERPKKFVVQRSKWLRGTVVKSVLLDAEGRMCCLGFVSAQCGVPDEDLIEVSQPCFTICQAHLVGLLVTPDGSHTDLAQYAMMLNDGRMRNDVREAQLSALFAEHGYEMEFVP